MFDVDYAPGVFAGIVFCVFLFPVLYGALVVDKYKHWEKKEEKEDVFN